jgi:hypothetical protein
MDAGDFASPRVIDLTYEHHRVSHGLWVWRCGSKQCRLSAISPVDFRACCPGHRRILLNRLLSCGRLPHQLAGFLVLGINPRLRFDDPYRDFCGLVTSQVSTAVTNARAYEEERARAEALEDIWRAGKTFSTIREELSLILRNGQRLLRLVNTLPYGLRKVARKVWKYSARIRRRSHWLCSI